MTTMLQRIRERAARSEEDELKFIFEYVLSYGRNPDLDEMSQWHDDRTRPLIDALIQAVEEADKCLEKISSTKGLKMLPIEKWPRDELQITVEYDTELSSEARASMQSILEAVGK